MAKKGAEFPPRTDPSSDGIPNPLASEILMRASELWAGKLEIIPTSLKEQKYISGEEFFVMDILAQNRKLKIEKAVKSSTKNLEEDADNQPKIHEAVSHAIVESVDDICEHTGVTGEKSRSMLIDRPMLDKWTRASAALTLNSHRATSLGLERETINPVIEQILSEHASDKWKKSNKNKLKTALSGGEEELVVFLQDYVDTFDTK